MELNTKNIKLWDLIKFCKEKNADRVKWNRKVNRDPGLYRPLINTKTVIWRWFFNRKMVYEFIKYELQNPF